MSDEMGYAAEGPREVLGHVSAALVKAKAKYYGRGPTQARTYLNDEYLFCVMSGGLTESEETLLRSGEYDAVRSYRLKFQDVVAPMLITTVEELIGRKVLTYHSQILFDPTRIFEIFVLEPQGE